MVNSVPRPRLRNKSPFFLFFCREPFETDLFAKQNLTHLNHEEFFKDNLNNRIYTKLIFELLIHERRRKNREKYSTYRSYPVDTLVLVKILKPRVHKKIKPIFEKIPKRVISEYRTLVYVEDIFGRVQKVSKNHVKKCP